MLVAKLFHMFICKRTLNLRCILQELINNMDDLYIYTQTVAKAHAQFACATYQRGTGAPERGRREVELVSTALLIFNFIKNALPFGPATNA